MVVIELILCLIRNPKLELVVAVLAWLSIALLAPSVVAANGGVSDDPELEEFIQEWFEADQAEDPRIEAEDPRIAFAVNDYIGVFSDAEVDELTRRLEQHYEDTGVQMAILVVDTTGFEPIEDFSLRIAEEWGGGSADRDDGLLFTLAISDRENRLEVGYGLESVIPDYYARRTLILIRDLLRDEEYAKASHRVIDNVIHATEHLDPDDALSAQYGVTVRKYYWIIMPIAILIALLLGYSAKRRTQEDDDASLPFATFAALAAVMLIFGSNPMEWIFLPLLVAFYIFCGVLLARLLPEFKKTAISFLLIYAAFKGFLIPQLDYPMFWQSTVDNVMFNVGAPLLLGALMGFLLLLVSMIILGDSHSYSSQRRRRRTSSSSSSSSRSSSRSSYSGGGGSFGGGGASGSW